VTEQITKLDCSTKKIKSKSKTALYKQKTMPTPWIRKRCP